MELTYRQILCITIIFPISAIIGPIGIPINIIVYLIIALRMMGII